jgi:hypothetical protein
VLRKIIKYLSLTIAGIVVILLVYLFAPALRHRWITYPRFEKQVNNFQALRKEVPKITSLNTYQGLLHAHSYWSHDSEGTLATIIPAAKNSGIDFIFLTDHPHGNLDTIPRGYSGYYDGVLIVPGSEKQGFCTWPLDSAIIDWSVNRDTVAKQVVQGGGIIFYAHSEEDHNWSTPWYQGIEIYNIHTDTKDESLTPHIFNFIVNGSKYRRWAMREMFDEQTSILALWDSLNSGRKIVGFSAVDAHENQNVRARYLADGRIEWLGPNAKPIDTVQLTIWNRWLFSNPDEEGWIFKLMVDTYEESFSFVTNYVVADSLSVPSLGDHIKKGHLYVAFKSLGDAGGFMYYSKDREGKVSGILGDSVALDQARSLHGVSPLPGQFRLIRNGELVETSGEGEYECNWPGPVKTGVYRIEVHITLGDETVPWVYSNPIYVY